MKRDQKFVFECFVEFGLLSCWKISSCNQEMSNLKSLLAFYQNDVLFLERFKPANATSFVILLGISPVKWLQERSMVVINPRFVSYSLFDPFHANIALSLKEYNLISVEHKTHKLTNSNNRESRTEERICLRHFFIHLNWLYTMAITCLYIGLKNN